jgi:hypothetical protein
LAVSGSGSGGGDYTLLAVIVNAPRSGVQVEFLLRFAPFFIFYSLLAFFVFFFFFFPLLLLSRRVGPSKNPRAFLRLRLLLLLIMFKQKKKKKKKKKKKHYLVRSVFVVMFEPSLISFRIHWLMIPDKNKNKGETDGDCINVAFITSTQKSLESETLNRKYFWFLPQFLSIYMSSFLFFSDAVQHTRTSGKR